MNEIPEAKDPNSVKDLLPLKPNDGEDVYADDNEEYDEEYEEYLSAASPPSSLNLSLIDSRAPHLIFAMRIMMTKMLINQ